MASRTVLLYQEDMQLLEAEATVVAVHRNAEAVDVVLDRTVFHARGGGQPADSGLLGAGRVVAVAADRATGAVRHTLAGEAEEPAVGAAVALKVDAAPRLLHSRLHTAGHVLDAAVAADAALAGLRPASAAHQPGQASVSYGGAAPPDAESKEAARVRLQAAVDALVGQHAAHAPSVVLLSPREGGEALARRVEELCHFCPEHLQAVEADQAAAMGQVRLVDCVPGDFVPCGGTHVAQIAQVGRIIVKSVKKGKRKTVRVSYDVEAK